VDVRKIAGLGKIIKFIPDWMIRILLHYINRGLNFENKYSPLVRALVNRKMYLRERMNRVDKVIVPTQVMLSNLLNNGLDRSRVVTLPFGLNLDYLADAKRPEPGNVLRLGYIGTIYEHKGVHILLEAIRKLRGSPVDLKIYGNLHDFPDYVNDLRKIAQDDPRVKFCGTFPNNQIASIFSELDILVVPSLWHENAPLVVYSAQAAGCPVIASDMEGMSEIIEHMKNGLLFKPASIPDLMSTIQLLLDDKSLLHKLSSNAKQPLSMQEYGLRLSAIYDELVPVKESL
jgi:glycosyltransferase involved in cell wall biosynthesis